MSRKSLPTCALILCALLVACAAAPARAIVIDPGLAAVLAEKDPPAQVPVILLFGDSFRPGDDLLTELQGVSASKRRAQLLAALKRMLRAADNGAMAVLTGPGSEAQVKNLRELYLAGALSFAASPGIINALGALPDQGTLYLDGVRVTSDASHPLAVPVRTQPAPADTAWGVKYIGAPRVWGGFGCDGAGVVIGHIDTGVWLAHPDLAAGIWRNPGEIIGNGIDDDGNGYVDDWRGWDFGDNDNNPDDDANGGGHGTHTAGTVIGNGANGTATGVAPGAKLIPVKVYNAAGLGGTLGTIWAAEQYCVEANARIITMSLGFVGSIPASFLRAERDNDANLRDCGVLLVNSAGNNHNDFDPPLELGLTARVPAPWSAVPAPYSSTGGVLTVGGTAYHSTSFYPLSSTGPARWDNIDPFNDWPYAPGPGLTKPDVCAPAVGINSTMVGGGYSGDTWNGTSMACPHVAGVAALMLQRNPSLSPAGIDSILEKTALDLGVAGKDNYFGSGLVNAYAAVAAVPLAQSPDLAWTQVLPDPAGDQVLDPGQATPMAFELHNVSRVQAATNVTATLEVVPNPWVSVVDGSAAFPDLAVAGGFGANTADPFSLAVGAGAPQGFPFTMMLTVTADGGFRRTFDIDWYVGLPNFRTHDLGGLAVTVTDQGSIGFMSDSHQDGEGVSFQGGGNVLYVGSFWAGTDVNYVCNRDYSGSGAEHYEWQASVEPNGRVKDLGGVGSDQTFQAVFTDAGHAAPKPLRVEQTSMAFTLPHDNRVVILEYSLANLGPVALPALYNGVFCDFDINGTMGDRAGTDPARRLSYMYGDGGGPYYGIALLGSTPAANVTAIDNLVYVYDTSSIDDTYKIRHLKGTISNPSGETTGDWSTLTSSVVSLPANGGQAVVAYALVTGATLADLQQAADAANMLYSPVAPVTGDVPAKVLHLGAGRPNPFNPVTAIDYAVAAPGRVLLEIYDTAGRRVRTLVDAARDAGSYTATWDGRSDDGGALPSGMYVCRMTSGGASAATKMTLLK